MTVLWGSAHDSSWSRGFAHQAWCCGLIQPCLIPFPVNFYFLPSGNGCAGFYEILYAVYAIRRCSKIVPLNILKSTLSAWIMLRVVRWEDNPPTWPHCAWSHLSVAMLAVLPAIYRWTQQPPVFKVHRKADDVITRTAMCRWSYESFVPQSVSGLETHQSVFNCCVAAVISNESLLLWRN
jgi:hypothetical protein